MNFLRRAWLRLLDGIWTWVNAWWSLPYALGAEVDEPEWVEDADRRARAAVTFLGDLCEPAAPASQPVRILFQIRRPDLRAAWHAGPPVDSVLVGMSDERGVTAEIRTPYMRATVPVQAIAMVLVNGRGEMFGGVRGGLNYEEGVRFRLEIHMTLAARTAVENDVIQGEEVSP